MRIHVLKSIIITALFPKANVMPISPAGKIQEILGFGRSFGSEYADTFFEDVRNRTEM